MLRLIHTSKSLCVLITCFQLLNQRGHRTRNGIGRIMQCLLASQTATTVYQKRTKERRNNINNKEQKAATANYTVSLTELNLSFNANFTPTPPEPIEYKL